jgi:sec-independent protein translocase protein TatC
MTSEPLTEGSQSLLEHLNELRVRLTWAAAGLILFTVISFPFAEILLKFLISPYGEQLQTLSPTEGIETYFKIALVAGATLAMPWILYQLWLFVAPGLHDNERRSVFVFVPSATILFLAGVAFSWLILLPSAIGFLSTFMSSIFLAGWTSREYISFATSFLFWLGVAFELPLIIYFLARFGVITSLMLREHWRVAVVGIAVIAAVVTPSIDPVTMLLTMLPLTILYLLSIGSSALGQRQFERAMALEDHSDDE